MEVEDHIRKAREFLAVSDREFAEADNMQASEKLWGAVAQSLIAFAKHRGLRYSTHRSMKDAAEAISQEIGNDAIEETFSLAEKFHANFYHDFMTEDRISSGRPVLRDFIHLALSLVADDYPQNNG